MANENQQIATLDSSVLSKVAETLEMLKAGGDIKIVDLFPSLNSALSGVVNGPSTPGSIFAGAVQSYATDVAIPKQDSDEDSIVDVLQVQDIKGDYQNTVFNFYAGNGGMKAKLRGVHDSPYVVIMFKGMVDSGKTGLKKFYKDYLFLGATSKDSAIAAAAALSNAVKVVAGKK